jgi:serine/threonine-protein kinase RsbW
MSARPVLNEASVAVRKGPLVGPVLGRVVGMLAARAQCPIDRLDDAMLLTDAVAAHAPAHTADGHVRVVVAADGTGLVLRVGALSRDGASGLLADAELPGVGNVFERVADEVHASASGTDGDGELVLRLRFATA